VFARLDNAESVPCIDPPGVFQDGVGPERDTFIPDRASEGDATGNQRVTNTATSSLAGIGDTDEDAYDTLNSARCVTLRPSEK
jgi:hypothetical protein